MKIILCVCLLFLSGCEKQDDIKSIEGLFVIEEIFMKDVINSGVLSQDQINDIKQRDKDIWDGINLAKKLKDGDHKKEVVSTTKDKIKSLSDTLNHEYKK